jgi:hypothetical protein
LKLIKNLNASKEEEIRQVERRGFDPTNNS